MGKTTTEPESTDRAERATHRSHPSTEGGRPCAPDTSPAAADAPNLGRVPCCACTSHTRDDDGLRAVAEAVSDPASTQYREFLSAADVRARYAPTDATVASVEQWLRAAGLRVLGVPTNHMFVEVEGTAKRVASAFGVRLGAYRVRGRVLRAADQNLSIPKDLDGVVSAVVGIDESQALMVPKHIADERPPRKPAPPSPGFRNARPCSAFWPELVRASLTGRCRSGGKLRR